MRMVPLPCARRWVLGDLVLLPLFWINLNQKCYTRIYPRYEDHFHFRLLAIQNCATLGGALPIVQAFFGTFLCITQQKLKETFVANFIQSFALELFILSHKKCRIISHVSSCAFWKVLELMKTSSTVAKFLWWNNFVGWNDRWDLLE